MNKTNGVLGAVFGAAMLGLAGCQSCSTPPVRECAEPVRECVEPVGAKEACPPVQAVGCPSTVTTVIQRNGVGCSALPPVGEITVVRNKCERAKMVFVAVRPNDDRSFDVESRNYERPWPWGPYRMGNCN